MAVKASWCLSYSWRDAKGQTRKITLCYDAASVAGGTAQEAAYLANSSFATVIALQACSNAHVQQEINYLTGGSSQSGITYGATGLYQSVSQQAHLTFLTVDPSGDPSPVGTLTIPAPLATGGDHGFGIFKADLVTVDPTCSEIVALIAALINAVPVTEGFSLATKSGLQYTTLVGGIYLGKKLSRRWNKFTKDPTLTIAGI
jgi:hypothetical protein